MDDSTHFPPEKITLFETELQGHYQADGFFVASEIHKVEAKALTVEDIPDQITQMIGQFPVKGDRVTVNVSWPSSEAERLAKASKVELTKFNLMFRNEPEVCLEYALWLDIRSSDALKREFPISFNELYLEVWQTTNKRIFKKMIIVQ